MDDADNGTTTTVKRMPDGQIELTVSTPASLDYPIPDEPEDETEDET